MFVVYDLYFVFLVLLLLLLHIVQCVCVYLNITFLLYIVYLPVLFKQVHACICSHRLP